jgi:ABC-2 type transport system permease protein
MRVLEIARKDLFHALRSLFLVVFAFGLPLLTAGVFYAAFGGLPSGSNPSPAAPVPVALANLDQPGLLGRTLQDILTGPGMKGVVETTVVPSAAEARAAVDAGQAAAAVIIPADFSRRLADPAQTAVLELYRDPAQAVGPAVVQAVVEQTLDGFSGARIAAVAGMRIFTERGIAPSADQAAGIADAYGEWLSRGAQNPSGAGWWTLRAAAPSGTGANTTAGMLSSIMAMMLVFYCFFTGASAAQSILQELEDGTLTRLFTTPTPRAVILGGKMLAVLVMLLLQVTVLVLVSAQLFGIHWGSLPGVAAAVAGTSLLSAGFGVFLISFLRSTKQAGVVFSVVINLTGWIGIIRLFAGIIPGMAKISGVTDIVSLLVPQGWAARIWQEAMSGSPAWVSLTVMLIVSAVLFWFGVRKFQRRFAA